MFLKYCFGAGTPLLTPDGWKAIEEFKPGDRVLSRDEWDPTGPAEPKLVEEVFTGTDRVFTVHTSGQEIRSTGEHRFWVVGRGWTAAGKLQPGESVVGRDGVRVAVEKVGDVTGPVVAVYNMRIADHHTYFVGKDEWGFSVWVHNSSDQKPSGEHQAHEKPADNSTQSDSDQVDANIDNHPSFPCQHKERIKKVLKAHRNLPEGEDQGDRPPRQTSRDADASKDDPVHETGWNNNKKSHEGKPEGSRTTPDRTPVHDRAAASEQAA